jgi:hypothetical protein
MTAARPRPKNWPQLGCRSRFYVYVPAVDRRYLPNAIHTPIYGVLYETLSVYGRLAHRCVIRPRKLR